jgi:HEAT repeat protein
MANDMQAVNTLIVVMSSNDYALSVRMAAAEGLGYAGGIEAREALMKVVKTDSFSNDLRAAAAKALGRAAKTQAGTRTDE